MSALTPEDPGRAASYWLTATITVTSRLDPGGAMPGFVHHRAACDHCGAPVGTRFAVEGIVICQVCQEALRPPATVPGATCRHPHWLQAARTHART